MVILFFGLHLGITETFLAADLTYNLWEIDTSLRFTNTEKIIDKAHPK